MLFLLMVFVLCYSACQLNVNYSFTLREKIVLLYLTIVKLNCCTFNFINLILNSEIQQLLLS